MSELQLNPPIIVGIDGSDHGLRALDWAAITAANRHWGIRLVNAVEPDRYVLGMAPPVITDASYSAHSATVLGAAQKHLEAHAHLGVDATIASLRGPVVPTLLNELNHGRMLVLGRRGLGRFAELLLGSVTAGCAARGKGAVVVVPPTWSAYSPAAGTVVLGVDGSELAEGAVGFAFEEASWRDARLHVVHSWQLPDPYSWEMAGWNGEEAWRTQAECAVAESIAGWRQKFPDVDVHVMVEHAHPVQNLVRHGSEADLLVIGGQPHGELRGALAGSTGAALLHHVDCPVAVVHARSAH